ncbi:hypothetical protein [Methyloligella solikamskensis]|uniref:Uncharacterized protein n=1 Tax=Methyloligella solikamskensis TaxID=1177756 RepID=A0ABW3J9H6_9HYPH
MRKFFFLSALVLGLTGGLLTVSVSGGSQAIAAQANSECLTGLNGCKAMCFGRDNRRRGQCLTSCKVQYRQCKRAAGTQ